MKTSKQPVTNTTAGGFAVVEGVLVVVVIGILGFTGWFVWQAKHNADTSLKQASASTPASAKNSSSNSLQLDSDFNAANHSLMQANSDQTDVTNSLNDSQQEVAVPTN